VVPSVHAPGSNGESLSSALARIARRADWRLLVALLMVGSIGAAAMILLVPQRWVLALWLVPPAAFAGGGSLIVRQRRARRLDPPLRA
jgi:hypothetical protein